MLPLRMARRSRARLPFRIGECDQNSVRYPSLLLLPWRRRLQAPSSSGHFPTSHPLTFIHQSIFVTFHLVIIALRHYAFHIMHAAYFTWHISFCFSYFRIFISPILHRSVCSV
ncbi:hypothetical protein IW261DRAFT_1058265 [Armillaria novae-zelandiae]|uniref:Uncharacterized protein n=1 Tax=Armillaria novae-zelandiae TaxID=153914 RepID=A0AA39NL25_9AGAR|nr:hypothetical protein IW261DRAFT_1058265 [Armillaria novae-zelandiae]